MPLHHKKIRHQHGKTMVQENCSYVQGIQNILSIPNFLPSHNSLMSQDNLYADMWRQQQHQHPKDTDDDST